MSQRYDVIGKVVVRHSIPPLGRSPRVPWTQVRIGGRWIPIVEEDTEPSVRFSAKVLWNEGVVRQRGVRVMS